MSDSTSIEWTDASWSPVTGCTRVSAGCDHCYIDRTPPFRMAGRRFSGPGTGATTGVKLHSERLGQPQRWRKPRRIFVCSLADLFQDEVPDRFIADVFAVMSIAAQHSYQVLTKRHARLRSLLNSEAFWVLVDNARAVRRYGPLSGPIVPVLPNVWLGVSVESQQWADIRIPALLETPAAVRWISAEPLLGPVDLERWLGRESVVGLFEGADGRENVEGRGVTWVVAGGESGPGARPMHPDWARSLRDQCASAGVAYFHKQNGQYGVVLDRPAAGDLWLAPDGATAEWQYGDGYVRRSGEEFCWPATRTVLMRRARSKHDAGRLLDGRTWDEYPEPSREVSGV